MSFRKRKNNTTSESNGKLSKRAKILSNLWNSQGTNSESAEGTQSLSSSSVYKIKAIIGERPAEYLIDWADDPITGQKFTPDWQPKANVNTAAIESWRGKRKSVPESSTNRRRRQKRRRRRPASSTGSNTREITVPLRNSQVQYISETSSHTSNPRSIQSLTKTSTSIQTRSSFYHEPTLPDITVQISQHSSLNSSLYSVYEYSVVSEGSSSSLLHLSGPNIRYSSPEPEASPIVATQGTIIVPDSQSQPGSSSYVPSSSNSRNAQFASTAGLGSSPTSATGISLTSQILTSSSLDPGAFPAAVRIIDPVEGSSHIEIAASRPLAGQSPHIAATATQRSVANSVISSASTLSLRSQINCPQSLNSQADITREGTQSLGGNSGRRSTGSELFEISEDPVYDSHPSQATTTDDSILSLRDPNSQKANSIQSEHFKDLTNTDSSVIFIKPTIPETLGSQEPPQPPSVYSDEMSDLPSNTGGVGGAFQQVSTKEKLTRMREESAAKKEAARRAQQSSPPGARASPSMNMERKLSQSSVRPESVQTSYRGLQPVLSPAIGPSIPPLARGEGQPPLSPVNRAIGASNYEPIQQRRSPISSPRLSQLPLSPAAQAPNVRTSGQQHPATTGVASPTINRDQLAVQIAQSGAGTDAPEIPNKLAYQVQDEPERLEVQPILISTELPLPMRSSQSVPHTPATPSRLSMHTETPPSQTVALQPKNLGKMEFIISLCMQARISRQYIDTMSFYTKSIIENMTKDNLSEQTIDDLNILLGRLANVSTHIGLEGGGPDSQDLIKPEQEAIYAELSSEKFKFLGALFEVAKDDNLHIALIAKAGPLHDIVETFLKGRAVKYSRPATFSRSKGAQGQLQVSVLESGSGAGNPIEVARKADLVIALDESFNAKDRQVVDLRKGNTGELAPVIRLIIYASVEHFDLCLPRTLEPIDRLRKLICCVWHTQEIIGKLEGHEPDSQTCAKIVASFLRGNCQTRAWRLPSIQAIQNLPLMDSDSSLSDAMSDVSIEVGRPSEFARKYWPYIPPAAANNHYVGMLQSNNGSLSNGKRAFDLEYGDSLEVQRKKQRMAKRAHAGLPLEEPHTSENLEKRLAEGKAREQQLTDELVRWKDTANGHAEGAEKRQFAYEELRAQCRNLQHDKLNLTEEVSKLTMALDKARLDRLSLQGERGNLKKDLEDSRQQLVNHTAPTIAEAAQKDARIRALEEENAAIKKKLDTTDGVLEYTRGMYQDTSNRAVELASDLENLQKVFEPTKSKLEHEILRRKHEAATDPKAQQLQLAFEEIQTLRTEIESKERMIKRKEDQITVLERGRAAGVQTRGSSAQPRSPRGPGSRGASPAAGLLSGNGGSNKGPSGLSGRFNIE